MAILAGAYAIINPSFEEPEILLQYNQASGFMDDLADRQLRTRLDEDSLFVYMKQLNMRGKVAAGQASANELPGVDIAASQLKTPTYLFKCRANYDHHDVQAGARWGFSTVEAYRLGMRQTHFQFARDANLFGMNPQFGEGLVNAPGATAVPLPADMNGNQTVLTYDNGAMAFFLAQQVQLLKTRTLQLGRGKRFTILGPQRTLGQFEYNIVQLTQFQRDGAGSASSKGTFEDIIMKNGDKLDWAYDDTLQGAGAGGANQDLVLLIMPELDKPSTDGISTNAFAGITPGNPVCTTQYADMAAPREITSPMAGGATDFMTEWRLTSGWAPRPQAVTIITMTYS